MLEVSIFWAHLLPWFKIITLSYHHKFLKSGVLFNYLELYRVVYTNNVMINVIL